MFQRGNQYCLSKYDEGKLFIGMWMLPCTPPNGKMKLTSMFGNLENYQTHFWSSNTYMPLHFIS